MFLNKRFYPGNNIKALIKFDFLCKNSIVPFITPRRVSIRKSEKIIDIEKKNGIKSNNEKPTKRMKN